MPHPLNLTIRLKQDEATKQKLAGLKAAFASRIQPKVAKALADSKIVHSARILVIDDRYLQVITEYDGDRQGYTEFFRRELRDIFQAVFELAEDAPPASAFDDPDAFYNYARSKNVPGLGEGEGDERSKAEGFLFHAFAEKTVVEIQEALAR